MDIWITPEVKRRQEKGNLPKPLALQAAQIIFHSDGKPDEIRINDEVKINVQAKIKKNVKKQIGEPIYLHETEKIENLNLREDEDPNACHISLCKFGNKWILAFDSIYNKGDAKNFIRVSKQFLDTAKYAAKQKNLNSFIDNAFSSVELAAKAFIVTIPSKQNKSMNHKRIHVQYNLHHKLGNINSKYCDTLNKLRENRSSARYDGREIELEENEISALLKIIEDMIYDTEKRIKLSLFSDDRVQ